MLLYQTARVQVSSFLEDHTERVQAEMRVAELQTHSAALDERGVNTNFINNPRQIEFNNWCASKGIDNIYLNSPLGICGLLSP